MSSVISEAVKKSTESQNPSFMDPMEPRERVRKSRWSKTKSFVPGMPTILPSNLDDAQRQGYLRKSNYYLITLINSFVLVQLEIEEATRKLRLADFSVPEGVERFVCTISKTNFLS